MKLLIGLALLAVAFATPLPVDLPEAPEPAVETDIDMSQPDIPLGVKLPEPELPEYVMDEVQMDESPADLPENTVQVVDINPDVPLDADVDANAEETVDAVQFADFAEEPLDVIEEAVDDEQVVDIAEEAPLDAVPEDVDAVQVVDIVAEEVPSDDIPEAVDPVQFADFAEEAPLDFNPDAVDDEQVNLVDETAFDTIPDAVDPVRVVDIADDVYAEETPINADDVMVPYLSDIPEDFAVDPVRIVESAPFEMEDSPVVIFDGEQFIDDIVADAVNIVDAPFPVDDFEAQDFDNTVNVFDGPIDLVFPNGLYDDALLR